MKYDFTSVYDRSSGSNKWNKMKEMKPSVETGIVPLSVADMEFANPPEILEGLKQYLDEVILGYPAPTQSFLDAVTSWTRRRYGWETKEEWLVTTPGVVNGFFHAVKTFTEPGDGVILLTPVYYPFYWSIEQNHRRVERCPLRFLGRRYEIDFDLLQGVAEKPENKLLILSNPHNPVGRVWSREELTRIGRICIDNDVFVVADEIHCDLIMPGHHFTPFASISEEFGEHSMTCMAPSKTFNLAGMQASCCFIPNAEKRKALLDEMFTMAQSNRLNSLAYKACELAYTKCDKWLSELLEVIEGNYRFVKTCLNEQCPKIGVIDMEGTYLMWLDLRAYGWSEEQQERIMLESDLFLDEGYLFGPEGSGFERINLACARTTLEEAVRRLVTAVEQNS